MLIWLQDLKKKKGGSSQDEAGKQAGIRSCSTVKLWLKIFAVIQGNGKCLARGVRYSNLYFSNITLPAI